MAKGEANVWKEERKRVGLFPNPWAARVLVLAQGAAPVNCALLTLGELVAKATARLADTLTREDWRYILAALEPVANKRLMDPRVKALEVVADLRDHAAIDKGHLRVWADEPDAKVDQLCRFADRWSDLDALAVLLACRHAVRIPDLDCEREDWWTLEHRNRASVQERRLIEDGDGDE